MIDMNDDNMILDGVVTSISKSLSGRWRISVAFDFAEYEQESKAIFNKMFNNPPTNVAVAILNNDTQSVESYGALAKRLYQSSFFLTRSVFAKIGTDDEYRTWLREQPCTFCKATQTEAAHVLRINAGAGMGHKPQYSAIPMCHECHMRQHNEGESALGGKEKFDMLKVKYLKKWGWETLKKTLGYDSWSKVPPDDLRRWAKDNEIYEFLPNCYKEQNNG
jgi:hypothetical protein